MVYTLFVQDHSRKIGQVSDTNIDKLRIFRDKINNGDLKEIFPNANVAIIMDSNMLYVN